MARTEDLPLRHARTLPWTLAALLLVGGPAASTFAFEGIKLERPTLENSGWSPHRQMTTTALRAALAGIRKGPESPAVKAFIDECAVGVCLVDWEEMSFDGPILKCNELYRPFHHFDRAPDAPHKEALAAGIKYIHESAATLAAAVIQDTKPDEPRLNDEEQRHIVVYGLAEILHACQDLYSHSNIADELDAAQQEEVAALLVRAVTGRAGAGGDAVPEVPASLAAAVKITSFSVDKGGDPADTQGYTHDKHAKDGEKHGEGFKKAYALAEAASKRIVAALLARCGGEKAVSVLTGE